MTENEVRRVTARFARLAESGRGRFWYQDAARWAKRTVGPTRASLLLRLLAATSPRSSIAANVRHARRAFGEIVSGAGLSGGYGVPANDANVRRVADGKRIRGPKVLPFAAALTGDRSAVPCDVWMMRAAGYDGAKNPRKGQAEVVRRACVRLAKRWGWEPREVQAAVWFNARERGGGSRWGTATYATAWRTISDALA